MTTTNNATKEKGKAILREKISTNLFCYSFLAIPLLYMIVFYFYVNLSSFVLPFFEQGSGKFGLGNFRLIFKDLSSGANSDILLNLKNTLIYFFVHFLMNPLAFILSYFIYKKVALYNFFKVVFVLPMIISSVIFVAIYKNMLSAGGPLDVLWLKLFGKNLPYPLYNESTATWAIVIYTVWTGFGMNLILFSGAMARIPDSIIEYAKLDGIGPGREMFQIVMPIIWPTFSTMMLLSIVGIFSADGPIILFTNGMYGTSTLGYWMYNNVILHDKYNYAATLGLLMTIATIPVFVFSRWLFKKMPDEITF